MIDQNPCFCELAPLYALDLLSEEEQEWLEQQIADCPELTEELTEYQSAVTALPYTAPLMPMARDLKGRLFDRLDLGAPETETVVEPPVRYHQAIRAQELNWQPQPTPGVLIAIVHTDEISREIVGFFKAEPGVRYPCHRHAAVEEIFMLEGDLIFGDQVYGAGDYIRSQPGSSHAPYTLRGCHFFFRTSMDDDYSHAIASIG
jgi:hypothetical protein